MLFGLVDEVADHLVIIVDQFTDVRGITEEYGVTEVLNGKFSC
ncbi:MAG: hypothetical protein ACOCRB_02310 [Halanaerobiaceae bacterium]